MMGRASGTGRIVDGKYEILTSIGRGGMSDVWLGRDCRLGKMWAIKEIKPNVMGAQADANRQAIIDEANFMKRLDHPAIPRVVDIIEDGPVVFVVMDYVDGISLSRALRRQGRPFDQEDVIDWGIQLCDVLGYLHARHPPVVYRDMKPGNVMLREDGSVKLVDFGIAEELLPGRGDDGRAIGSPGYSAPEQIDPCLHERFPTDTRADVYALGATLHSLVTGEVPHRVRQPDGSDTFELSLQPIREVNPKLSDGLERILLTATRRNPGERYQTIDEMRYDLEHYEELTQEHRAAQQRKVDAFRGRLRAAGAAAAVGIVCLVASLAVRNGSYGNLVHEAGAASTDETNVRVGDPSHGVARTADPSEAERLYTQAIDVDPSRLGTYECLVGVYKADQTFTPTEARRWTQVWQRHGQRLEGDARYARLCYDVGVLYLCYYDYLGTMDANASGAGEGGLTTGQGAVESATRSAEWFRRARDACDPSTGDYRGLEVSDRLDEYAATRVYGVIGEFHTRFSQANREGRDMTETYLEFWEGLSEVVRGRDGGAPIASQSEPIVQLRLYQVAFESIGSPTYLAGLMRAGVRRPDVDDLLSTVKARVDGLADFVESNRASAGAMYDEIEQGYGAAAANVRRTYNSPVATLSTGESEEGDRR